MTALNRSLSGKLFIYHVDKDPPDRDINLLIKVTNRQIPGWINVPGLSPSEELLKQLEKWQWDSKWPRMWPKYKKLYKHELIQIPLKNLHLRHLLKRLNQGFDVAIACDCGDEQHCHKQIIGEWINQQGIPVVQGKEIRKERKKISPSNIEQLTLLEVEH